MRKRQKRNKKVDYSIFIHIGFIAIFVAVCLFVIYAGGQKDVNTILKTTEDFYKTKMEMTENVSPAKIVSKPQSVNVNLPAYKKYNFKYVHYINLPAGFTQIIMKVPIPSDEVERQYISSLKINPKPAKLYFDGRDNVAEFIFQNPPQGKIPVSVEGVASLRNYDLATAKLINKNISKEKDLSQYLKSESLIESDDPYIKTIAAKIQGNSREEIVQNIYEYLQNNIKYTVIPKDIGAKAALKQKRGKCSEYATAMVALCRAKNIPARYVSGNFARETSPKHSWVEVYYDEYGWVTYDPTSQGAIVMVRKPNGQVVRKEQRLDSTKLNINYIASSRRMLASWSLKYVITRQINGNLFVTDDIKIKKVE